MWTDRRLHSGIAVHWHMDKGWSANKGIQCPATEGYL